MGMYSWVYPVWFCVDSAHKNNESVCTSDFTVRVPKVSWLLVLKGIEAGPLNEDDMFIWVATVKGAKDTMWEGLYMHYEPYGGLGLSH